METPFSEWQKNGVCDTASSVPLQQLKFTIPRSTDVANLQFVLRSADSSLWYKDGSSNFSVPIATRTADAAAAVGGAAAAEAVTDPLLLEIIAAERTEKWTLMHRFNRAADLLDDVLAGVYEDTAAAMAAIYVWLRYSATRHLTWQRNYNTQPRILSAAQARLTSTIARAHAETTGEAQEWVRPCSLSVHDAFASVHPLLIS
jgi:alpha-glucan, water dikinase